MALIGGDFIVRPGVEFAFGEFLDPQGRVVAAPAIVDGKVNENPDLLENVVRRAGRRGAARKNLLDMLARHLRDLAVSDFFVKQQPVYDAAIGALSATRQRKIVCALIIIADESVEGSKRDSCPLFRFWRFAALQRLLVGGHEFRRAGLARQRCARTLPAPEIIPAMAMPANEVIDILEFHRGQGSTRSAELTQNRPSYHRLRRKWARLLHPHAAAP